MSHPASVERRRWVNRLSGNNDHLGSLEAPQMARFTAIMHRILDKPRNALGPHWFQVDISKADIEDLAAATEGIIELGREWEETYHRVNQARNSALAAERERYKMALETCANALEKIAKLEAEVVRLRVEGAGLRRQVADLAEGG